MLFEQYPKEVINVVMLLDFAIGVFHGMKMKPSLEKAQELKDKIKV